MSTDDARKSGSGFADALNPFRSTGKRLDTATGGLDMGARRYRPDIARFNQRDQCTGALANLALGADPLTGNRYALAAGRSGTSMSPTAVAAGPRPSRSSAISIGHTTISNDRIVSQRSSRRALARGRPHYGPHQPQDR